MELANVANYRQVKKRLKAKEDLNFQELFSKNYTLWATDKYGDLFVTIDQGAQCLHVGVSDDYDRHVNDAIIAWEPNENVYGVVETIAHYIQEVKKYICNQPFLS